MALKKPGRAEKRAFKPKAFRKEKNADLLASVATRVRYLESQHHCAVGGAQPARRRSQPASKCPRRWTANEALAALRTSIRAGLVSEERNGDFPRYVWYREGEETIYEARSEPHTPERYHGYPVEPYEVPGELNW